MIRVAINGLGRIGRSIFRQIIDNNEFELVAVNEVNPDANNIAYTINYDTLYGRMDEQVSLINDELSYGKKTIPLFHENDISLVPWAELGADYIIDASGVIENANEAKSLLHKNPKLRHFFVTFSPGCEDITLVLGANEDKLKEKDKLISTSICDATAIAPVLKALGEKYTIKNGHITTLHPWLNYQNLMDGPSSSWSIPGEIYHHYALGRSSIGNMIPKPTTAVDVSLKSLPENLNGKLGSFSYRTPTAIVASADITLTLDNKVSKNDISATLRNYSKRYGFNLFKVTDEPLVSLDYVKTDYSAIVDDRWTQVIDNNLVKIVLWYDNEYGYSSRVIDQVKYVHSKFYSEQLKSFK